MICEKEGTFFMIPYRDQVIKVENSLSLKASAQME